MKTQLRVLLLLLLLPFTALGSKARMAVVGPAIALPDDVQEMFSNPAKLFTTQDQFNIESGATNEAGLWLSHQNSKFGVYYGHRNDFYDELVTDAGSGLPLEQNPLELFYGQKSEDSAWGLSIWGSSGEDKTAKAKVDSKGLRLGYRRGEFEVFAQAGGISRSMIDSLMTAQINSMYRLGGDYGIDDIWYSVDLETTNATTTPNGGAAAQRSFSSITLGFEFIEESSEAFFFYGAKILNTQTKRDPATDVVLRLPFYFGIESKPGDGFQWRGYLQQSMVLNSRKADPGTGAPATIDNNGVDDLQVALGVSYQWGRVRMDGTLSAGTTGILVTDNLLAQTSLIYFF